MREKGASSAVFQSSLLPRAGEKVAEGRMRGWLQDKARAVLRC
jgi:hypothetical protein